MFISLRGLAAAGHNGAVTFKGLPVTPQRLDQAPGWSASAGPGCRQPRLPPMPSRLPKGGSGPGMESPSGTLAVE
ncbi:hypothetical protein GCM10007175_29610 [Pseudarthrobacter scleromae]|uniref:Uncharacterized protein n=1 Tax=Pseudarthrobacter scleromae TaxID=158897 RepID=A0ABQ2CHW5_9MICC|nr:hypothetical protein GCM10007175_29610 [Pseudarthrobacter scleromae]